MRWFPHKGYGLPLWSTRATSTIVSYEVWGYALNDNSEEQRILTNTPQQLAHAIHALYKSRYVAASIPFVATEQVFMCQGVMVREWCSGRCPGRSGSCCIRTGCAVNMLTVGSDFTLRTRQVLADVPGGTAP